MEELEQQIYLSYIRRFEQVLDCIQGDIFSS